MEECTKYYKTNNIESMQDIVKTVGLMLKIDVIKYIMSINNCYEISSKYGNVEFIKTLFWLILPVIYACLKG